MNSEEIEVDGQVIHVVLPASNIEVKEATVTYQDGTGHAEVVCSSAPLAAEFASTLKALSQGT